MVKTPCLKCFLTTQINLLSQFCALGLLRINQFYKRSILPRLPSERERDGRRFWANLQQRLMFFGIEKFSANSIQPLRMNGISSNTDYAISFQLLLMRIASLVRNEQKNFC